MRIKINIKPSTVEIPAKEIFNLTKSYLHILIGPDNEYHGNVSMYSITPPMRGKYIKENKTFQYCNGTYMVFSTLDQKLIDTILPNIYKVKFGNTLDLFGIDIIEESFTNGNNYITTLSPILLKTHEIGNKKVNCVTFEDKEIFEKLLTEKTIKKLKYEYDSLDLDNFKISLTNDNRYNKINKIPVNKIPNTASQCNMVINTNKEVMNILYNIGLGMSTGCGFGTFYNTNNYHLYNISK